MNALFSHGAGIWRTLSRSFKISILRRVKRIHRTIAKLLVVNGYLPKLGLAAVIGCVTGLVAVAFHFGLGTAIEWVRKPWTLGILPWYAFAAVPAIGGLVVGLFIYKVARAPETAGQGTDKMIYSFHHQGGNVRARVAPVKFIASIVTLATGGSAGYEGPISQIGSGIASTICKFFKMPRMMRGQFMLAGTAAGLGAIFKAPLAGALTLGASNWLHDGFSVYECGGAFCVCVAWNSMFPVFILVCATLLRVRASL